MKPARTAAIFHNLFLTCFRKEFIINRDARPFSNLLSYAFEKIPGGVVKKLLAI